MDMKEIKHLIKLMVHNDLTELEIVEGENKIELKRGVGGVPVVMAAPAHAPVLLETTMVLSGVIPLVLRVYRSSCGGLNETSFSYNA